MLNVIFGEAGSGKTKRLIEMANEAVKAAKSEVVYVDTSKRYMYDLAHQIRFVDISEFKIKDPLALYGFLCGIIARNFDIDSIFVNDFLKIANTELDKTEDMLLKLDELSTAMSVNIVAEITGALDKVPPFLNKYIV